MSNYTKAAQTAIEKMKAATPPAKEITKEFYAAVAALGWDIQVRVNTRTCKQWVKTHWLGFGRTETWEEEVGRMACLSYKEGGNNVAERHVALKEDGGLPVIFVEYVLDKMLGTYVPNIITENGDSWGPFSGEGQEALLQCLGLVPKRAEGATLCELPDLGPGALLNEWGDYYQGGCRLYPLICLREEAEKILTDYVRQALEG